MRTRRWALSAGLGLAAVALTPGARASVQQTSKALRFQNLHTGESLEAEYWRGGVYASDALAAVDHILRDFRTGEVHIIDRRLLDLLFDLSASLETPQPFQIISGYRSPHTNAALAEASGGVARHSLHMEGMAIDIAVEGVSTDTVRAAALDLRRGGVGYYPDPGFVHVDVDRVRRW